MQRALFQQVTPIQFQSQATRVLPGNGTGAQDPAVNDDIYHDAGSRVRMVFTVLANVVGGVLLLSGLFVLPHVIAGILS